MIGPVPIAQNGSFVSISSRCAGSIAVTGSTQPGRPVASGRYRSPARLIVIRIGTGVAAAIALHGMPQAASSCALASGMVLIAARYSARSRSIISRRGRPGAPDGASAGGGVCQAHAENCLRCAAGLIQRLPGALCQVRAKFFLAMRQVLRHKWPRTRRSSVAFCASCNFPRFAVSPIGPGAFLQKRPGPLIFGAVPLRRGRTRRPPASTGPRARNFHRRRER
jgi:hypothetical protein